jgi:LmbE family N-acetylglucosaminyl deacetylase
MRGYSSAVPTTLAIISPHLDDAVLSLGAAIRSWTSSGAEVAVLTVLADDPGSSAPAAEWDRRCGFSTEGEAAAARREEDRRACELVGARAIWLPFRDGTYGLPSDFERVWEAVDPSLGSAATVLIPGFPLVHEDHAWLSRHLLPRLLQRIPRIGLYTEQPYAGNRRHMWPPRVGDGLSPLPPGWHAEWRPVEVGSADRRVKMRAVKEYRSQISALTRKPLFHRRIARYDASHGGEMIGWLVPPGRNGSPDRPQVLGTQLP